MRALRIATVVAVVAAGLAVPVLPASGEPPTGSVRTIDVTDWNRGELQAQAAKGSWAVAAPVEATSTAMVGASWRGEQTRDVEVRALRRGTWGPWQSLRSAPDHGPDPGTPEAASARKATDPLWLGDVQQVQVRVRGSAPADFTLHAVEFTGGDGLDYLPPELQAAGAAAAAPSRPTIVPRRSWDPRNQCAPRRSPSYAEEVRFAVVHHTASTNGYAASRGPAQVLATCLYHRNSRGWTDVGYNAIIDRYGVIYEGRAGGLTEPVVGAHAAGFNSGSFGVSLLGCFEPGLCSGDVNPPDRMVAALRRLLAWKLDHHHVDPQGTTREVSGGGSTTRFSNGTAVTLPTIIGHRHTGTTSCPGDRLYRHVASGQLHRDVTELGGPKLFGGPPPRIDQPVLGSRPQWQVELSQRGPWRLEITDARGRTVRDARGTGGSLDLSWDLRDERGREVAPGRYRAEVTSSSATPITTTLDVTASARRAAGPTRIETAVELSRWAFDDARREASGRAQAGTVVIASAEAYPDALVASPLASSYRGPVLLSYRDTLPDVVAAEIRRLGATRAILVGGPIRLSEGLASQLRSRTGIRTVERLAGATRYHTAGRVAWRIVEREHPSEALLALGHHPDPDRAFQDALLAGGYGATFDLPVLLVQPNDLTPPSQWVLEQRDWSRGVSVVGGRGVIRNTVTTAARAASGATVRSFAGSDFYATSRILADERVRRAPWTADEAVLATGQNWPDALGAAAAAAEHGSSLLLTHGDRLDRSSATEDWLRDHAETLDTVVTAGGPVAVADRVLQHADGIIRSAGPHRAPPQPW